jgi:hypothetical protein
MGAHRVGGLRTLTLEQAPDLSFKRLHLALSAVSPLSILDELSPILGDGLMDQAAAIWD